ncbi:hypothetical protein JCM3765_003640 [Sporobolomyces pararoseus]
MSGYYIETITYSYKNEMDWYFNEQDIATLKSKRTLSIDGKDGVWKLEFVPGPHIDDKPFARLTALPQAEDFQRADSRNSWGRGNYTCSLKLLLHSDSTLSSFSRGDPVELYICSSIPTASKECRYTLKSLLKEFRLNGTLGLECTVSSSSHCPIPTSLSTNKLLSFFDRPACADTVFSFSNGDDDGETSHIFACKAILSVPSSHFQALFDANDVSTKDFDLKTNRPEHHLISQTLVEEELAPFFQSRAVVSGSAGAGERSMKRIKLDESGEAQSQEGEMKRLIVIEIRERDFRTFRAMIAYLHNSYAPFYSVASNYLVELFKDRKPGDNFDKYSDSPTQWLQDQLRNGPYSLDSRIEPCSPYEMYRLADKYGIEDLKTFTLNFICRSLTHENVAFELFSPLSLEFKPVRESILDFFVKNWVDVKNTKGFNVVLDKLTSGQLSQGRELMSSIFKQMVT